MEIVRMWETRLHPATADTFWSALRQAWTELTSYDGFARGQAFSAGGGESRAVVLTYWRDEAAAAAAGRWEEALDPFAERPGHAWHFCEIPVNPAVNAETGEPW